MYRKIISLVIALIFILGLVLSGCGAAKTVTPPASRGVTGKISLGKSGAATTQSITAGGGSLTVKIPGSPIDGLKLDVPSGTYPQTADFTISYTPINKQSFGKNCHPLTPLITVEGGDDFSREVMTITVPVAVPAGQFAMGFIYDAASGRLTGMNTVAQDSKSITLATRHFCDFFISAIDEALLKKDIDTGFFPGKDDWQFTNRGSHLAPGGHCAGQSVTALWYYVTQPEGWNVTLFGRYDNNGEKPATPGLDEDDALGYRFASVVHDDIDWNSWENKFWTDLAGFNDHLTYNLFAYSMQLTGEPQEIGIFSKAGGGHDMICYRIKDGELYIADPNYPGATDRRIHYHSDNASFDPYQSGANEEAIKKGKTKAYEIIQFCTKSTTVSWDTIAKRWKEMKNGTIGDAQFPAYKLVYKDDKGDILDLPDGFVSPWPKLIMGVQSTDGSVKVSTLLYRDGVILPGGTKSEADLLPGNNKIGVYVCTVSREEYNGKFYDIDKFVDFTYVNIVYRPLSIDPAIARGETGQLLTFTVKADNPPAGTEFLWQVDGVIQQVDSMKTFVTSFDQAGEYAIVVTMLDKDGLEVATAAAAVTITKAAAPSGLKIGAKNMWIDTMSYGWVHYSTPAGYSGEMGMLIAPAAEFTNLTWQGASFQGDNGEYTVEGEVNPDNSITLILKFKDRTIRELDIFITNLPWVAEKGRWIVLGADGQYHLTISSKYHDQNGETQDLLYLRWDSQATHAGLLTVNVVLYD